ncbi:HNH endonuclease [bacterium]|nr:HNH endonuclease [bacterium]
MDRMISYEDMKNRIKICGTMDKKQKSEFLETYKKNYDLWLDELKQKLDDYSPLFTDLDTRRSISPSFNYQEHNLKGEIWKEFPLDSRYMVSNLGRVRFDGKIQKQKDDKMQYVTLTDENLRKDYIYNFVAFTFLGKIEGDGYHVHHITNDGYDNSVDNLVLLTATEHSIVHGFKIGGGVNE